MDKPVGAEGNPASEISYQGDRVVTRKVEIATGAAGQRTPSYTTEVYDGFGRLERVCEGRPTAWTGNCDGVETVYEYDESGNLAHVCSAATESGCGQERIFTRDNRGFLYAAPHTGSSGHATSNHAYGALLSDRVPIQPSTE